MSKKVGRGRKRSKPVEAGGKYSVTLPEKFNEEYLQLLEQKAENEEGGLNAAFLFFLNIGLETCSQNIDKREDQAIKLKLNYLPEAKIKEISQWLAQPASQKAIELILLFLAGGQKELGLFSDLISEIKSPNNSISENKSEIKVNEFAKRLINTGFS